MSKFDSSGNLSFDPDEFRINKKMILRFMDAIQKRWERDLTNKIKNAKYVMGMEAMKLGVKFTDDDTISAVWHDIIGGFNELITLNQMCRLKGEFPHYEKLCDIVIAKIESGETVRAKK